MTLRLLLCAALVAAALCGLPAFAAPNACPALLDRSFPDLLTGKNRSLCEFSGKVVLVVNTASKCAFTPQYEGLETLYKKYASRGFVIIGFPSNDFAEQEPGSNKDVAEFCQYNYGVSFPMFEKTSVRGPQANALYAALAQRGGGAPQWNFHKYLIDRDGSHVIGFASAIAPESPRIRRELEKLLAP